MISDRELWACAQHLLTAHDEAARTVIAERVRALAVTGDVAGVDVWLAIADRVDRLRDTQGRGHARH